MGVGAGLQHLLQLVGMPPREGHPARHGAVDKPVQLRPQVFACLRWRGAMLALGLQVPASADNELLRTL